MRLPRWTLPVYSSTQAWLLGKSNFYCSRFVLGVYKARRVESHAVVLFHFSFYCNSRARLHAGWNHDHTHCTAYLLRHLRKILLLTAIAHNKEATSACELLAAIPPEQLTNKLRVNNNSKIYNTHELRRQHDDEHLDIGLKVKLTVEDLDKLDLVFQPQNGGNIDDPPLKMGEYLWKCLFSVPPPPTASIPLADVEREIRQHLSIELTLNNYENDKEENEDEAVNAMAKLSLKNTMEEKSRLKEMTYSRLRGTTVLLKPSPPDNEGASVNSNEPNFNVGSGKLHDLTISDCSDAHFYLLRPFEQCTIAACNNCTIVVGAVAGLVHIVDCEKTNITATSRRFLISNSCDVQMFVFSPSPPLMVGDNRTCQFAPYNTYYDGLREDLLATGLAAAVLPDHAIRNENDASWPPLQCASNKWKQPIDVSKLEVPQGLGSPTGSPINSAAAPLSPGADDRATSGSDSTLQAPILLPPSEFNILFVPIERHDHEDETKTPADEQENVESHYCRYLAEVLQLSPFRLPIEYERIVLSKAERMKNIQQAVKKHLTAEQQHQFEEELNRGFRDWLVSSGNLRQVLDLVHLANQHQDLSTTQKRGVE